MDTLEAITSRTSAVKLVGPGPTREQLDQILGAALRAPDHGRLAPWRFVVMQGEGRKALAQSYMGVKRQTNPDATEKDIAAEALKAFRAPVVVAVATSAGAETKVPWIEQVVATGAAVQNMFLAAHAQGVGAMWKTGDVVYSDETKRLLGLKDADQIVALLYLGTAEKLPPTRSVEVGEAVSWLS